MALRVGGIVEEAAIRAPSGRCDEDGQTRLLQVTTGDRGQSGFDMRLMVAATGRTCRPPSTTYTQPPEVRFALADRSEAAIPGFSIPLIATCRSNPRRRYCALRRPETPASARSIFDSSDPHDRSLRKRSCNKKYRFTPCGVDRKSTRLNSSH